MASKKKDGELMERFNCCMSKCGLIHVVAGVGVGFLLVQYLGLMDVAVWGWLLVAAGFVGHLVGKAHH